MKKRNVKEKIQNLFECDNVRIISPVDTFYAIIGEKTSTKTDLGQCMKNGSPVDFEYLDETIVGMGETLNDLLEAVKEYKELSEMSMEEFLRKQFLKEKDYLVQID